MQQDEHSGMVEGKKGNQKASRARSQQHQQQQHQYPPPQIENVSIGDRIHSLIYGYLLTNGLHTTAEAFQQESEYLRNTIPRVDPGKPSQVIVLNDRLHERNLEEIVQIHNREGYFRLPDRMSEFGNELSHLNSKFQSLVSHYGVPHQRRLQQRMFGPSASRNQPPQHFSLNPAPQAYAAMELQKINQEAAERYRQEQQSLGGTNTSAIQISQQQPAQQNLNVQEHVPHQQNQQFQQIPQELEQQFQQQQEPFEQAADQHGSSRRKHTQPLHMNDRYENTLHTLVDRINEGNYEVDANLDLDFLHTMEFNSISFELNRGDQGELQYFEDIFHEEIVNNDQNDQNLQHDALDDVPETQDLQVDQRYSSPPEQLLSPVLRAPDYRLHTQGGSSLPSTSEAQAAGTVPNDNYAVPRKRDNSMTSDNKHDEKKDSEKDKWSRKSELRNERSSRHSSPSYSHSKSDESSRYREHEKGSQRDRSGHEKREKRKEEGRVSHDNPPSSSHRYTSGDNRSKVQEERESTPSSTSSRTTHSERRDDDKEKKRRERKDREKHEAEEREKEKQRAKAKKEKEDQEKSKYSGQSSSSANREYQPQHVLNTMRTSHAAGGVRPFESHTQHTESSSSGGAKRKVDATIQSGSKPVPFKIPKKTSGSTSSDQRQSAGGSHESSRTSSPRSERPRKSPSQELMTDGGDDRAIATHFISPMGHLARLSSILHNCDANYQAFHNDQPPKENSSRAESNSPTPSTPRTPVVNLVPNPKGKMFAPMKGDRSDMLKGNDSEKSSSSSGTYSSSDDDSHDKKSERSSSSNSSNDSRSKKPVDEMQAQKLLERVHRKK